VIWDRVERKARHLGVFSSEEDAARAFDKEVIRTQGANNSGLNFRDSECDRLLLLLLLLLLLESAGSVG
jgi:hypothetical protein